MMTKEENIRNLANKLGAKIKIDGMTVYIKKPIFQFQKVAKKIGYTVEVRPDAFRKLPKANSADQYAPQQNSQPKADTKICPFCKKPLDVSSADCGYTPAMGFFHISCQRQQRH